MDYEHVKKQLGYGIQTESKDNAIKALEQLQAKVAELEEENARLVKLDAKRKKQLSDFDDVIDDLNVAVSCINPVEDLKRAVANLKEQAAASQAYAEQLREALTTCVCAMQDYQAGIGITEMFDKGERLGRKALAQPSNTSALDAYVAEKVKEKTDALHYRMEHCYSIDHVKIQCELDKITRQRDLAVQAMREALECGEDGDWQSARRILASVIKESDGK